MMKIRLLIVYLMLCGLSPATPTYGQATNENTGTEMNSVDYDAAEGYGGSIEYNKFRDEQSAYRLRASDLIGAGVYDNQEVKIGEIDDLVMGHETDSVSAIISIGGFLGVGDRLVAVPYEELRISANGEQVYLADSHEYLEDYEPFEYNVGESFGIDKVRSRREYLQSRTQ